MKSLPMALATILWIGATIEISSATASEPREAAKTAEVKPASTAETTAAVTDKIKLPPGFYQKKHGKHMLYCKRDATLGTRIQSERCYDDRGMRDYLLALQETKSEVDRVRATCSNLCVCGSPESC